MYKAFISYSHAADGKLAPALQVALEQFAKPWYKLRHLNIFRDESSLSASPHLWENIKTALDESEYLVYMASPESARSKWVIKEIEYWLEHKSADTLLIAITDGEIIWDKTKLTNGSEDNDNALPEVLRNTFRDEPFYVDLRASKTIVDVSLNNPIFKKEVLKLAAHLHGKAPKDMAGDEVKAHNRMIRIRNAVILLLVSLSIFLVYQYSQTKIALRQAEMELRQGQVSKRNQVESDIRAENAEAKIELIDLMIQNGVSAKDAISTLKQLDERNAIDLWRIDSLAITKSSVAQGLYKIEFLGWNNKIMAEVDSLKLSLKKDK